MPCNKRGPYRKTVERAQRLKLEQTLHDILHDEKVSSEAKLSAVEMLMKLGVL